MSSKSKSVERQSKVLNIQKNDKLKLLLINKYCTKYKSKKIN